MEDTAIIELYWLRDETAIVQTDRKYGPLCRNLAYNILSNWEDSEECVNDTWHRAWDTIPPQRPDSLRAYLGRIVRNLSISRWLRTLGQDDRLYVLRRAGLSPDHAGRRGRYHRPAGRRFGFRPLGSHLVFQ